jgi:glycerate kinase
MKKAPVIAIAPDSFKGAISAIGAALAIGDGLLESFPTAKLRIIPMADGGEGTVDAWAASAGARRIKTTVQDPLGRPVKAEYAYNAATHTAVIEMAAASGLPLLASDERNPLVTSTYGTGELVRDAFNRGARHIILGIGGSATNDGGTGMAAALGVRFLDAKGRELPPGGAALARLASIDMSGLDPRVAKTRFEAACDVTNPLCGALGASAIYGPQKGASKKDVKALDAALLHFAEAAKATKGIARRSDPKAAGAGAAGGLGFGLMAFCGAKLRSGVKIIAESVKLRERIEGCDLVITGEGRLDAQTVNGKTPAGVAKVARQAGVPCIAICGCVGEGYEAVHKIGIESVIPVAHGFYDPENPSKGAHERIRACAVEVGRLLKLAWR